MASGQRTLQTLAAIIPALCLLACAEKEPSQPAYCVTIAPLGLVLERLCAGRADVITLLEAQASPHTYDPRPIDAYRAARCLALFSVSPALDGWAAKLPAPRNVSVFEEALPNELWLLSPLGCAHGGQDSHEHGSECAPDPHFWSDPLAVSASLPGMLKVLCATDPDGASQYKENARTFEAELNETHAKVQRLLEPVAGCKVLSMHASLAYLYSRYGIQLAGVVEEWPGKEPTPRDLSALAAAANQGGAKVLVTEPGVSRRIADVIARETGVGVVELFPESLPPGASSYCDWLLANAGILAAALD